MLQLVLTVIIFMIIVIPIGNYLYHIASGQRTFADPVFDRVDGGIFGLSGIRFSRGSTLSGSICTSRRPLCGPKIGDGKGDVEVVGQSNWRDDF